MISFWSFAWAWDLARHAFAVLGGGAAFPDLAGRASMIRSPTPRFRRAVHWNGASQRITPFLVCADSFSGACGSPSAIRDRLERAGLPISPRVFLAVSGAAAVVLFTAGWFRLGAAPAGPACAISAEAAQALQYACEWGPVHRDVKPGNLLIPAAAPPRVKIVDFGLARLREPGNADTIVLPSPGQFAGTPDYAVAAGSRVWSAAAESVSRISLPSMVASLQLNSLPGQAYVVLPMVILAAILITRC